MIRTRTVLVINYLVIKNEQLILSYGLYERNNDSFSSDKSNTRKEKDIQVIKEHYEKTIRMKVTVKKIEICVEKLHRKRI